jgi:hypothetical protein
MCLYIMTVAGATVQEAVTYMQHIDNCTMLVSDLLAAPQVCFPTHGNAPLITSPRRARKEVPA